MPHKITQTPIKIQGQVAVGQEVRLNCVGYKNPETRPYIVVDVDHRGGWVPDRDLKRLKAWVDDCWKKRTKRKKKREGTC